MTPPASLNPILLPAATETVSVAGVRLILQVAPLEVTSLIGAFSAGIRTALVDSPEFVIKVEKMTMGGKEVLAKRVGTQMKKVDITHNGQKHWAQMQWTTRKVE